MKVLAMNHALSLPKVENKTSICPPLAPKLQKLLFLFLAFLVCAFLLEAVAPIQAETRVLWVWGFFQRNPGRLMMVFEL